MSDSISQYGPKGAAIQTAAQGLHGKKLLTDAEFKELTNGTFSQRDFQAASAAIERAKALPGLSPEFSSAVKMNSDLVGLRPQMAKDPNEKPMGLGEALGGLLKVMMQ